MTLLAFAITYSGFFLLRLAASSYPTLSFTQKPPVERQVSLRLFGALLLALSCGLSVSAFGWALGSIFWPVLLTPMAIAVVLLPLYAPRAAVMLAVASPAFALAAELVSMI